MDVNREKDLEGCYGDSRRHSIYCKTTQRSTEPVMYQALKFRWIVLVADCITLNTHSHSNSNV